MFDVNTILVKGQDLVFLQNCFELGAGSYDPLQQTRTAFRIVETGPNHLKTLIPVQERNFNHIRGLHACALATISEFTTGFMLISKLDGKKYRLIMQRLEMDYHYQGKMDAVASFEASDEWMQTHVYDPLKNNESTVVICEVKIHDTQCNHLTTGRVHWQIKDWQKVKTKSLHRIIRKS